MLNTVQLYTTKGLSHGHKVEIHFYNSFFSFVSTAACKAFINIPALLLFYIQLTGSWTKNYAHDLKLLKDTFVKNNV